MKAKQIEWETCFNGTVLRGMVGNLVAYSAECRGTTVTADCSIGDWYLFVAMFKEQFLTRKFQDICEDHFKQSLFQFLEVSDEDK